MTKLFEKNKLTFALVWIGAYVILASLADSLSDSLGISKIITVPLLLAMALALTVWMRKEGLTANFGLCAFRGNPRDYLWFLPLVLLLTVNLWQGIRWNLSPLETLLYIASMLLVGFLEELIFRGLLFKAMLESGVTSAVIVSSLTFGMGHIVNLLNGAEFLPTLLQVLYAVAIGFLFTLLFYKGKSLWPCILTHGIFNSLSVFSVEPDTTGRLVSCLALCLIPAAYSLWLLRRLGPLGKTPR